MFAEPVKEIKNIHGRKHTWQNQTLKPGENLLSGIEAELSHIIAEFTIGDGAEFGFVIRGVPVVYNLAERTLCCKGKSAELKPAGGRIRLEILVDRTSVEIFGNSGRVYMPIGVILPEENKTLEIFSKAGKTGLDLLEVYELRSAWR